MLIIQAASMPADMIACYDAGSFAASKHLEKGKAVMMKPDENHDSRVIVFFF
jgi:hypothetical protein